MATAIQVLGVDFSENYSPAMSDKIFQVLLLLMVHFGLVVKIINFEKAFLNEELEEEIYMKCPPGMNDVGKDDCIILQKYIYSLIQATRRYNKKAVEIK